MTRLTLVKNEFPVWGTIQGEGVLVGTPSVFVRMHGCDFSCEWCDTKGSWRPDSLREEWPLEDVLKAARETGLSHAVVTGGNPLLQAEALADLVAGLQTEHQVGGRERQGMHVTVETQGSVYDEAVARMVNLLSLSPKLHDWRWDPLLDLVRTSLSRGNQVQVKVVCTSLEDTELAIQNMIELHRRFWLDAPRNLHFVLQPESSLGRKGVQVVHLGLTKWISERRDGFVYPVIRVIPQLHKVAYFVR